MGSSSGGIFAVVLSELGAHTSIHHHQFAPSYISVQAVRGCDHPYSLKFTRVWCPMVSRQSPIRNQPQHILYQKRPHDFQRMSMMRPADHLHHSLLVPSHLLYVLWLQGERSQGTRPVVSFYQSMLLRFVVRTLHRYSRKTFWPQKSKIRTLLRKLRRYLFKEFQCDFSINFKKIADLFFLTSIPSSSRLQLPEHRPSPVYHFFSIFSP